MPGRLYSLLAQRNQTLATSAFLTGRPRSPWLWPVYYCVFLFQGNIYLIFWRDFILSMKNVSYVIAVFGVELGSSELELTMASCLKVPFPIYLLRSHACHMAAPLWILVVCCCWDMGLLDRKRLEGEKNQVITKSRKVLRVELGFTYSMRHLRPFLSDYKGYLGNPPLQADHQGVKDVLSARESTDPLTGEKQPHPLQGLQYRCFKECCLLSWFVAHQMIWSPHTWVLGPGSQCWTLVSGRDKSCADCWWEANLCEKLISDNP